MLLNIVDCYNGLWKSQMIQVSSDYSPVLINDDRVFSEKCVIKFHHCANTTEFTQVFIGVI